MSNTLYRQLFQAYPSTWGNVPEAYHPIFEKNFEEGMGALLTSLYPMGQELLIDLALYFGQFRIPQDLSDCYSAIAASLSKRSIEASVAFGTLNYDCLLEMALAYRGIDLTYNLESGPSRRIPVWKLHGSSNFLPDLKVTKVIGATFQGVQQFYDGPIRAVGLNDVAKYYAGEPGNRESIPPTMSVHAPGKPSKVSQAVLEQIRREWASWAPEVETFVVVGARPILDESHVWDPVIGSRGRVFYVGGASPGLEDLRRKISGRLHVIGSRFEDSLPRILQVID